MTFIVMAEYWDLEDQREGKVGPSNPVEVARRETYEEARLVVREIENDECTAYVEEV